MEDIVLNGISINQLKEMREAVRKDAVKFIADAIAKVKVLVNDIVNLQEQDKVEILAKEAFELLDSANLVAGVSGVTYDLPYYDEYGYSDGTALSSILDEPDEHVSRDTEEDDEGCAVELHTYGDGYISKLYDLLGEMESQVRDWNTSNC